jgi:hypothetical protein
MSYDLMVFDKSSAPKTRVEFIKWYELQTEWGEEHTYDDPSVSSKQLKDWFLDMIKVFPALNGPYATEEENDRVADYSVGRDVIYAAFAWSMAGQAYKTMLELAQKHQVGFFDVSSENGDILIPINGKLESLDKGDKKNWWKFWS